MALMVGALFAVFLAGALGAITVIALAAIGPHTIGLTGAEQEDNEDEEEAEAPPERPDPPEESGGEQSSSQGVPPSSYDGTSTTVGQFRVDCEVAYTDNSITDGMGSHASPPAGHEYRIYRLIRECSGVHAGGESDPNLRPPVRTGVSGPRCKRAAR